MLITGRNSLLHTVLFLRLTIRRTSLSVLHKIMIDTEYVSVSLLYARLPKAFSLDYDVKLIIWGLTVTQYISLQTA